MRASERSDFYGRLIEPPPPSFEAVRDAHGRKAETATEAEQRERRRTTKPAPKGRRRGPRGTSSMEKLDLDETAENPHRSAI